MIEYKVNEKEKCEYLSFEGDLIFLCSEVSNLIHKMYTAMNKKNQAGAALFKEMIKAVVLDDDSPMWNNNLLKK